MTKAHLHTPKGLWGEEGRRMATLPGCSQAIPGAINPQKAHLEERRSMMARGN